MTAKRLALILIAAALAAPAPARADVVLGWGATTAHVANNPILNELAAMGTVFWTARGVPQPPGQIYLVDKMDGAGAYTVGTDMYFPPQLLAFVQTHPTADKAAVILCLDVFHEKGHTGGLPHSATGVMSVTPSSDPASYLPWPCVVWARDRRTTSVAAARARRSAQQAQSPAAPAAR
jgi:hypothetical protein